jgi:tetratricopeptide (TPR) repeat protein
VSRSLGWLYYVGRRLDLALPQLERALSLNPTSEETLWVYGLALTDLGRHEEARAALTDADAATRGANHHAYAALARLNVLTGRRDEAEAALEALRDTARSRYVSPVDFARIHLALGDGDGAFGWLEKAYEERRGWLAYLRIEPLLDPIRSDPRFSELVRRMKLD